MQTYLNHDVRDSGKDSQGCELRFVYYTEKLWKLICLECKEKQSITNEVQGRTGRTAVTQEL